VKPAAVPSPGHPIDTLLPRFQHVIDMFLDRQRSTMSEISPDTLPLFDAAVQLLGAGKRLRPTFCYWGWRAAGGSPDDAGVITVAAALELFQASALVHDDVIDDSDTRRGQPSVHRRFAEQHRAARWHGSPESFGAAAAVLLGDLLLGWSDELFGSAELGPDALRRGRAVFDLMRTEVGSGQYLDVLEQVSGATRTVGHTERARQVIRFKSARYSVEHPLIIGATVAGLDDQLLSPYRRYGAALGEAFQLRDDILGVFGDPARTGKPAGDDLREGKRTVLVACALERADAAQTRLVNRLLGDPGLDDEGVEQLRAVLVETEALRRVETMVAQRVTDAREALESAKATDDGREALARLIDLATDRTR